MQRFVPHQLSKSRDKFRKACYQLLKCARRLLEICRLAPDEFNNAVRIQIKKVAQKLVRRLSFNMRGQLSEIPEVHRNDDLSSDCNSHRHNVAVLWIIGHTRNKILVPGRHCLWKGPIHLCH